MFDYRVELLKQYQQLLLEWKNNNMLYNSLEFYKVYNGDVENSHLVISLIGNQGMKNDIMTSWWTPTKYFLLGNMKGYRVELTEYLIKIIPKENDRDILQEKLSEIRYGKDSGKIIDEEVVEAFVDFLGAVYSIGNITNAALTTKGGALDNWDSKLDNIKKSFTSVGEWKKYVEDNCFEDYFKDEEYNVIIPFWSYGASKLAQATDKDWLEYFVNVKNRIELREKRFSK